MACSLAADGLISGRRPTGGLADGLVGGRRPAGGLADQGRLVVGLQPVREAIRAHRSALRRVAIDDRPSPQLEAVARFAKDQGVSRIERVARAELDRVSAGVSHQGAAAWAPELELVAPDRLFDDPELAGLALDSIQDPQNFGALIRSAVGIAGAAVLFAEHGAAPLSTATTRASAGAIEHARLCRVSSLSFALHQASERGIAVVGLDAHAETELRTLDLTRPTLLVLGAEHAGLRRSTRRSCTTLARLCTPTRIDSLNVSVAAGIALYELRIQREKSDI